MDINQDHIAILKAVRKFRLEFDPAKVFENKNPFQSEKMVYELVRSGHIRKYKCKGYRLTDLGLNVVSKPKAEKEDCEYKFLEIHSIFGIEKDEIVILKNTAKQLGLKLTDILYVYRCEYLTLNDLRIIETISKNLKQAYEQRDNKAA